MIKASRLPTEGVRCREILRIAVAGDIQVIATIAGNALGAVIGAAADTCRKTARRAGYRWIQLGNKGILATVSADIIGAKVDGRKFAEVV